MIIINTKTDNMTSMINMRFTFLVLSVNLLPMSQ